MENSRAGLAWRTLRQVHLWVGLGLGLLFIPLGLSGAVLVFGTEADRLLDPARYAVTAGAVEQAAGVYLANAAAAEPGRRTIVMRWPQSAGLPVTVLLRGGGGEEARVAYLDPLTGRVLGVAGSGNSIVSFAHELHANLMAGDFGGRQIVGWIGAGLLAMALTGVYMWWPRSSGLLRALRWRRGLKVSGNLHHMVGFWIAAPLVVMALTGIYLSFPQQMRAVIAVFADLTPQAPRQRPDNGPGQRPAQDPQRVIELALQTGEGLRPLSLSPPAGPSKLWRVQVLAGDGEPQTVLVDDTTSVVTVSRALTTGDAFTVWLRKVHDAKHHGPVWRIIAFLCGAAPAILLVTGTIIWLGRRGLVASSLRQRARRLRGPRASRPSNV